MAWIYYNSDIFFWYSDFIEAAFEASSSSSSFSFSGFGFTFRSLLVTSTKSYWSDLKLVFILSCSFSFCLAFSTLSSIGSYLPVPPT